MTASTLLLSILLVLGFGTNRTLAQDSRAQVIETFRTYVELNNGFVSSVRGGKDSSGKPYTQLRKDVEEFGEGEYTDALDMAKRLICKNADTELLDEFFLVLLATTNSADEYPSFVLGELFICDPELVTKQMARLELSDQNTIYEAVNWGFLGVTHGRQQDIPNYETLAERLKQLNPENKQ